MEVILLKTVENVGFQGDLLKVADGYARNYLFPRTLAVPASAGAKKNLAAQQEQQKQQAQKRYEADVQVANKLKAISPLVVEASVGDDGKLFGTITPKEVARLLEEKSGVTIDRKNLTIGRALNRVGAYDLEYRLSTLVKVALVVEVTPVAAVAQ
jgi:large subunit ribosomal protein L9